MINSVMKDEKELKEYFWDLYNSCYINKNEKFPNIDILYYDKYFNTQCKLKTILGEEIIYPTEPSGIPLFQLNWDSCKLFVIYDVFELLLNTVIDDITLKKHQNLKRLFKKWFNEHDKLYKFDIYVIPQINSINLNF